MVRNHVTLENSFRGLWIKQILVRLLQKEMWWNRLTTCKVLAWTRSFWAKELKGRKGLARHLWFCIWLLLFYLQYWEFISNHQSNIRQHPGSINFYSSYHQASQVCSLWRELLSVHCEICALPPVIRNELHRPIHVEYKIEETMKKIIWAANLHCKRQTSTNYFDQLKPICLFISISPGQPFLGSSTGKKAQ